MRRRITDPYEALGLDRNATQADVRRAYLRLVKRHHPDKNPDDKASEWIFKEIQSAYETLRDAKESQQVDNREPPPQGERAERRQPDAAPHDRRQRQSERAERENHGRSRQSQSQAAREHQEHARTTHTTSEGSGTVSHPVSWTHVCATRHGVARIPRALRAACDTPAFRGASTGCSVRRTRRRPRAPRRGFERPGRRRLAP